MPFDHNAKHFTLVPGTYMTRDGLRAEVFAIRPRYDGEMAAIGCTFNAAGEVTNACDWNASTGSFWLAGAECDFDIVDRVRA